MARERVRAVCLCEDERQRSFLLRLFERLGVRPVRVAVAPRGAGSAEHWVRRQLVRETTAFRSQAPHQANLVLVAMTDGDRFGVEARKAALDEELAVHGGERRRAAERIVYLVPTWSIETWLLWLCARAPGGDDGSISESAPYKDSYQRLLDARLVSVQRAIAAWEPPLPGENASVPSLRDARLELERVP